MARIFGRALRVVDRLYQFTAEALTAPLEFSTESPIQPVHDFSRESELGAILTAPGAGGLFSLDQDNVHAAGGEVVEATIDPYGTLDSTWGKVNERWIWLMRFAGSASSAATMGAGSAASLAVSIGAVGNALVRRDYLMAAWTATFGYTTSLSATFPVALSNPAAGIGPQFGTILPFPLPPNSNVTWRTQATAAAPGTIRIEMICWIGPFGVYPPGMY